MSWNGSVWGEMQSAGVSSLNTLTGALTLAGTTNQISITPAGSTLTFATPQDIAPGSSPAFTGLRLTGITGSTGRPTVLTSTGAFATSTAFTDASKFGYAFASSAAANTASLISAIAALPATGGTLYIPSDPAGCPTINAEIPVTKALIVRGDGSGRVDTIGASGSCIRATNATQNIFAVNTNSPFVIRDIALVSTVASDGAGISLTSPGVVSGLSGTQSFQAENVKFLGLWLGVYSVSSLFAVIDKSAFWDCVSTCIYWTNTQNADQGDFVVTNTTLYGPATAYGLIWRSGGGMRFLGNKCLGLLACLSFDPTGNTGDFIVALNSIESFDVVGIQFLRTSGSASITYAQILGNQISRLVGLGGGVPNYCITFGTASATYVTDIQIGWNFCADVSVGMLLAGGTRFRVSDNDFLRITTGAARGIWAASPAADVQIGANRFTTATTEVYDPDGVVTRLTIPNAIFPNSIQFPSTGSAFVAAIGAPTGLAASYSLIMPTGLPAATRCLEWTSSGQVQSAAAACGGGGGGGTVTNTGTLGAGGLVYGNGGVDVSAVVLNGFVKANGASAPTASATIPTSGGGLGTDLSASSGLPTLNAGTSVINNVLTATRVLYAAASNAVASSANLTFDGTTLKLLGIATGSTTCLQIDSVGVVGVSGATCGGGGGAGVSSINTTATGGVIIQGTASQVTVGTAGSTLTLSLPATINVDTSGNAATATVAAGLPTGVAGRVPFYSGVNAISNDAALSWANTDKHLAISSNASPLQTVASTASVRQRWASASGTATSLEADAYGAQAEVLFVRANGTPAARTTLVADNGIGALQFQGAYDASNFSAGQASFGCFAGGTWSSVSRPTYCTIGVTPSGSTTLTEAIRFLSTGAVQLAFALPVTSGGTGLAAGTSGGIPYFSTSTTMGSSLALTNHGMVVGGGSGTAPRGLTAMTNGQIYIGSTGADPVPGAIASSTMSSTLGAGSLTLDVTGILGGCVGCVPFWTSTTAVGNSTDLTWDNSLKRLTLRTSAASFQQQFSILNSSNTGRPLFYMGDGSAHGLVIGHTNNSGLASYGWITYNGLDPTTGVGLIVDSAGKVGMGTTTPVFLLDVVASAGQRGARMSRLVLADALSSSAFELCANCYFTPGSDKALVTGFSGRVEFIPSVGTWKIQTAPSAAADAAITLTDRVVVTQPGLMGVNQTTPLHWLDIGNTSSSGTRISAARLAGAITGAIATTTLSIEAGDGCSSAAQSAGLCVTLGPAGVTFPLYVSGPFVDFANTLNIGTSFANATAASAIKNTVTIAAMGSGGASGSVGQLVYSTYGGTAASGHLENYGIASQNTINIGSSPDANFIGLASQMFVKSTVGGTVQAATLQIVNTAAVGGDVDGLEIKNGVDQTTTNLVTATDAIKIRARQGASVGVEGFVKAIHLKDDQAGGLSRFVVANSGLTTIAPSVVSQQQLAIVSLTGDANGANIKLTNTGGSGNPNKTITALNDNFLVRNQALGTILALNDAGTTLTLPGYNIGGGQTAACISGAGVLVRC